MTSEELNYKKKLQRRISIKRAGEEFVGRMALKTRNDFRLAYLVVFQPGLPEYELCHRAWCYLGDVKSKWKEVE